MSAFKVPQEVSQANQFKQKFPGQGVPKQSDFLRKRLQGKGGGQYFDSGDYNMQRSGKNNDATIFIGKEIPNPENIPKRKPSCTRQTTLVEGDPGSPRKDDEKPTDQVEEQASKQNLADE